MAFLVRSRGGSSDPRRGNLELCSEVASQITNDFFVYFWIMTGRIHCNILCCIFLEKVTGEGPSKSPIAYRKGWEKVTGEEIGVVEGDKVGEGV